MTWRWLPNAICVVRLLLVAPVVILLLDGRYAAALVLFMVAGASDAVDGFLAKHFAWQSRLGSLLDPVADKLLIVSVFLSLAWLGLVPAALAAVVVLRDAVIVLGALTYQLLVAPVEGQPTAISKLNTACQLGFVVFVLSREVEVLGWPADISLLVLGAAVVFTSITSGLAYVVGWGRRAWRVRHGIAP